MSPVVAIRKCTSYARYEVEKAVHRLFHDSGGIEQHIRPGMSVLIKPNLLAPRKREEAVNTDPAVVRAVLKEVLRTGAKAVIGDSPGLGKAVKNADRCGIGAVAAEFGVPIIEFRDSIVVGKTREGGFPLELAREALEAEVIINLPKLKTHAQMLMTLGVKNLFGCVVGKRKLQWHFKAGVNREAFARMLVEIYAALKPALTLIDGIVGMEGNGPGSGTPKPFGILAASTDAIALDTVIMTLMGMKPSRLATIRAAGGINAGETSLKKIEVRGDSMESLRIPDLEVPQSSDLEWPLPGFLRKILKSSFTAYPEPDPKQCNLCRICLEACPQQVIFVEKEQLAINTRRCIRCFCCQELCPRGAMKTRQGWLLKRLQK
ncbi:MAG: DUF362 domain-containing protein [Deltaproteobacteria bacterium]|nr:DUF362 domain-containing protein [Deltaproteobacteria bacterium]